MMVDESSNLQRRFYNLVRDTFCAVYFIVAGLHVKRTNTTNNTNTNNKNINIINNFKNLFLKTKQKEIKEKREERKKYGDI